MQFKSCFYVLLLFLSVSLSGCATLFGGGSTQTIHIVTSDGQAHTAFVELPGQEPSLYTLPIPAAFSVERSYKDIIITVEDVSGQETGFTVVKSKLNPWFIGDIIATSLLSSTIDFATGAAWKYDEMIEVNPRMNKETVKQAKEAYYSAKQGK